MKNNKMINFIKKLILTKYFLFLILIATPVTIVIAASVPNSFTGGTTISSSDVNANFDYLADRSWEKSGSDLYYNSGNVGIGTTSPQTTLDVNGTIQAQKLSSITGQNEMIFSAGGTDLLNISRALSNHPDHQGYYVRKMELLGPTDGTQDLGEFDVYGRIKISGDNRHATVGIGPGLSLHSTFSNSSVNRHLYISLGDTWNNLGTSEDDLIIHSWNNSWQNHVQHMVLKANGNVGIGTTTSPSYKLHVNGTAAGTSWTNLSSREYKENIRKVDVSEHGDMLDRLMELELTRYNYKKEFGGDNTAKLGFIAEEMPSEVLSKDGKGVDIYELLAFTIGAMKAQQEEIKNLKGELGKLTEHLHTSM